MVPVDIKVVVIRRQRAPLKDIHESPVVSMKRHMVRNDILKPEHVFFLQVARQRPKVVAITDLGIDLMRICYIITVQTSRSGAHHRGGVDRANAQRVEIIDEALERAKRKVLVQLYPVSRRGKVHMRLSDFKNTN